MSRYTSTYDHTLHGVKKTFFLYYFQGFSTEETIKPYINNFESILVPKNNEKQNPDESNTNKYQKHVAFSWGYKLACVDDNFSNSFKSYLNEFFVYNFNNKMIEEIKYCIDIMKKEHFNKEPVILKKTMKILGTLLNVGFVMMIMFCT